MMYTIRDILHRRRRGFCGLRGLGALARPAMVAAVPSYTAVLGQGTITPKNGYDDYLGLVFRTNVNINVTHLGRWIIAASSATHTLSILDASANILASVSLAMAGKTPGDYAFVALDTPLTLTSAVDYYICSLEISGGDDWSESTAITKSADISFIASGLRASGVMITAAGGESYGPMNFKYTKP